jgi:two-component system cell cycle response regulator
MPNTSFHVKGFVNHSGHKAESASIQAQSLDEESMTGRILIVDDVATNRIVMKVKLVEACYSVEQADSGAVALRSVGKPPRSHHPRRADAGYVRPRGLSADQGRSRDRRHPVLLVTALSDRASKMAGLEAGPTIS